MDEETVKRIRAAGAYAGLHSEVKLAGALGISKDNLRRIFDGSRPWRELETGEAGFLQKVADVTNVPIEFFSLGFEPLRGGSSFATITVPASSMSTPALVKALSAVRELADQLGEIEGLDILLSPGDQAPADETSPDVATRYGDAYETAPKAPKPEEHGETAAARPNRKGAS